MLPFPNDFFTVEDASTETGRRVDFNVLAMPRNVAGKPIDPTDWNRADGFSPGSLIVTKVPGIDTPRRSRRPTRSRSPTSARYTAKDAPVVVIDTTHRQALAWSGRSSTSNGRADPRGPRAAHPPGEELPRGPPLRRRAARHARPRRQGHPGAATASPPSATASADRRRAPRALRGRSSATLRAAGIERDVALPGLGLHRRQRPSRSPAACCTSATTRSPRLGDTNLADLQGRRAARRSSRSSASST